jgi:hypothetical protein
LLLVSKGLLSAEYRGTSRSQDRPALASKRNRPVRPGEQSAAGALRIDMSKFIKFGRITTAVRAAARAKGITGDPFAEVPPFLCTAGAELIAAEIFLDVPKSVRKAAPKLCMQLCRSIVHSYSKDAA